jgi:2-polyprenyl-6-methoxyphenol hydroxylase-like FAD-dependent oxidoreductase
VRQIGRDYRNLFAAAAIRLVFEEDEKQVRDLTTEVAVVGGGPAGLTAAIALASAGVETVLIAKGRSAPDHRTTALLASSVRAIDTLGVWDQCREHAAPLRVLRIVDLLQARSGSMLSAATSRTGFSPQRLQRAPMRLEH